MSTGLAYAYGAGLGFRHAADQVEGGARETVDGLHAAPDSPTGRPRPGDRDGARRQDLAAAQIPDQMPALAALKRAQIEGPAVTAIYLDLAEAADAVDKLERIEAPQKLGLCEMEEAGGPEHEAVDGEWGEGAGLEVAHEESH
jgi:hypothetical protein